MNFQPNNLETNAIEVITENVFSSLINLDELNLRYNKISQMSENSFEGLAKIKILDLISNQLKSLPMNAISSTLLELKVIYFDNNEIEEI